MLPVIIVEGKNDRSRIRRVLSEEVNVLCTFGTPGSEQLAKLRRQAGRQPVFIFTDNDAQGKKIRALLSDAFPEAEHMYTRKGYAGVEGTPEEYLIQQLEKAELDEFILYPTPDQLLRHELEQINDKRHRKNAEYRRSENGL